MAGETHISICGNLTADPELRTLNNGGMVASFTIAATPRQFNKQSNQWENGPALFMRCAAWRDLAPHVSQSLAKGMRVIAEGRLSQRSYEAKDGTKRTVVEMTVDEIGPSLRYATAQVMRVNQSNGFAPAQQQSAQQNVTYGNPQQPVGDQSGDPWAGSGGWDDGTAF